MENRSDYLIIGGGISGLATAFFLQRRGHSVQVLETASQPGGSLRSHQEQGFLIEAGPNSTLENTDALGELIDGTNIRDQLQVANPLAKRRYILKNGQLVPMPLGPGAFLSTPLFSRRGKWRLLAEPFVGRAREEESIAQFVRRRLGQEFLDWAIDPFISGVYAGDPERLSVRASVAKIYALEKEYGSLIRGALARTMKGRKTGPAPSGRLISFAGGMQTLAKGVATKLGEGVFRGNANVTGLQRDGQGWRVVLAGDTDVFTAKRVVLAVPAHVAANLLEPLNTHVAATLRDIHYPPVASVALGFRREQVEHPLDGFGFLIPRRCGVETLGSLFSSTLFPERAPAGHILLTSFIGGRRNPAIAGLTSEELEQRVRRDLSPLLGLHGEPVWRRISYWPQAIPQYELGHLERVAAVEQALAGYGILLRANWRDGISVSNCVQAARELAAQQSGHPPSRA